MKKSTSFFCQKYVANFNYNLKTRFLAYQDLMFYYLTTTGASGAIYHQRGLKMPEEQGIKCIFRHH